MKNHILAIGISEHQNSSSNLSYAAKDASMFFELLKSNLSDIGYAKLLTNSEATLAQIQSSLGMELNNEVQKDDRFFFFYSGHGALGAKRDDQSEATSYLVPFDATQDLASSCISIEYLKHVFEVLPSKTKLIFVDSCFSGAVSKNGKLYSVPSTKAFKFTSTFSNTAIGEGTLIFTASKDDEASLEDPELNQGLFTHFLLEEFQQERTGSSFAPMDLFSPVAAQVSERAKTRWKHNQVPTFHGKVQGALTLPIFKKRLNITPATIGIPLNPELAKLSSPIAEIGIPAGGQEEMLDGYIKYVTDNASKSRDLLFERHCSKLFRSLKKEWENIFAQNGPRVDEIPTSVTKFEAATFQVLMLSGVLAVFGTARQMDIFYDYLTPLLTWKTNKAGLVALASIPDLALVHVIYITAILGVATGNLEPLHRLLETEIELSRDSSASPRPLYKFSYIHYSESLGGAATKVNEHIRDTLKMNQWLPLLCPKIEDATDSFQLQANLLISTYQMHKQDRLWPDFGRWPAEEVLPLVRRVKSSKVFREQVAKLFQIKEAEVQEVLRTNVSKLEQRGFDGRGWRSIHPDVFLD